MSQAQYISTAQAATALGVSVSTVKRWVDEGILPAHRTAGGHRKLLRAEVLALARQGDLPRHDLAGLVILPEKKKPVDVEVIPTALHAALVGGHAAEARGLIHRAYRCGMPMETLADRVIAPVMQKVGHDWETERIDVWHEHRGTLICSSALHELQTELAARAERRRPVAIGGTPEGDPYLLATLLAQLVLLDAGWEAIQLGPNTPLSSFVRAVDELRPKLIWLSVSYLVDIQRFLGEYRELYQTAERKGVAVAVGGRALVEGLRSRMPYTTYGDGLTHLAAFAHTLHPRPARPPRGRPRRNGASGSTRSQL